MSYGVLFIRLVLGLMLAAHGAQKLFGWFGGHGLRGTGGFFAQLGFRAPRRMALAAGLSEFGGGLLLAAGLLTPLAALAIAVVMLNAIATVHLRNGFWNSGGGYEFNLLVWAAAVALAATGGAKFSLDALFGWADALSGAWSGLGVLGLSALVSAVTLRIGRRPAREGTREASRDRAAPLVTGT
jgi:putative oxidoreductase